MILKKCYPINIIENYTIYSKFGINIRNIHFSCAVDNRLRGFYMEKYDTLKMQQEAEIINNIGEQNIYGFNVKGLLPYKDSPYLFRIKNLYENNIDFFTESESKQINSILQIIKNESAPFALLTGNPASGKSVLAYKIATEIEKNEENYKTYYYTCREEISPTDLINDLKFYNQINPKSKKLYIIDDIHISPSRVFYFFNRVKSENIRCAILFVSRIAKDSKEEKIIDEGIYEELKSVTYQLEFSLYKTSEYDILNINDKVKANLKSMSKIEGIVKKFSQKYNLLTPSSEDISGLFNKTGFDLLNLFYYLSVWKEESDLNSNIELHLIDERDVLKHVYSENLSNKEPKERDVIIKYACMYQFETWFEVQYDDYNIVTPLLEDGIIVRDKKVYSFYHSKFAELLIKSYMYCDDYFDIKYQNLFDLVTINISNYIKSYTYNRIRKYPNNIFELFDGMLGGRNRYLQNTAEDNSIIFKTLIENNEIKNIVLNFFDSSNVEAIKIKKFKDFVLKYANEIYWDIEANLIYKNNYNWLKDKIVKISSNDNFLAFILFINEYEEFYYSFSDLEIRSLILDSDSNALKSLYSINNATIRNNVKNLLTEKEWFLTLQDSSIDKIKDTLIFIDKIDNNYAISLFDQFSDDEIIKKIQENFIIGLTYILSIIWKLNKQKTKTIIAEFDNDYIYENLLNYIRNHKEERNLQVISDFFHKIYSVDSDKAIKLFSKMGYDEINSLLTLYDVPAIVSFLSEIKRINQEMASSFFDSIDFELLCDKIVKEPANKILNSISEIKYLNEDKARQLIFYTREVLIKTIPNIKLETFLSYEKKGIIVIEKEITSEIMGRLPDEYIKNYYKLSDMRDLTRLISLYRYLDFDVWNKRYILDEIFEYVDKNFTKKYLHKKWLSSTMNLLEVCSLYGRKIKSVGNDDSKAILKDILLAKGNLGHFIRNITTIKKHDQDLAEELQLELGFQLDVINNQMKGMGIFMNTILIEILKFVGASVGSGVTWDFIKKSSNNIIERFKNKFFGEKYFDSEENCDEFFHILCVNPSNNDEEPFDDVKTLYKKYAKGKQYDVFEQSLKNWLLENASDILMSNRDNTGISVFKDSIVEQKAQTINNIGVQNNH